MKLSPDQVSALAQYKEELGARKIDTERIEALVARRRATYESHFSPEAQARELSYHFGEWKKELLPTILAIRKVNTQIKSVSEVLARISSSVQPTKKLAVEIAKIQMPQLHLSKELTEQLSTQVNTAVAKIKATYYLETERAETFTLAHLKEVYGLSDEDLASILHVTARTIKNNLEDPVPDKWLHFYSSLLNFRKVTGIYFPDNSSFHHFIKKGNVEVNTAMGQLPVFDMLRQYDLGGLELLHRRLLQQAEGVHV